MRLFALCLLATLFACAAPAPVAPLAYTRVGPPPAKALAGDDDLLALLTSDITVANLLDDAERRRVQVLLAIPDDDGTTRQLSYRADAEYFYPASAVKLAVAVAAIEKLAALHGEPADATVDMRLRWRSRRGARTTAVEMPMRRLLELSLVVSDNEAHNALFDLVGREELAERLTAFGLPNVRVADRLGDPRGKPNTLFDVLSADDDPVRVSNRPGRAPPANEAPRSDVGVFHVDGAGRKKSGPMSFAERNRMSLADLQGLLVAVARPELTDRVHVDLTPLDREALLAILEAPPSTLGFAASNDDVHKPLLATIRDALPGHRIRVYGKGGRAYGFSVENVYVVDETTNRSFFLTASIYANDNRTLNDDRYDYRSVADPFVIALGRLLALSVLGGT